MERRPLVLMFILEGVAVLFTDFIKHRLDKGGKDTKVIFVLECAVHPVLRVFRFHSVRAIRFASIRGG